MYNKLDRNMSKAIIYKPTKSATQSGKSKSKIWVLEYETSKSQHADSLMGWIGNGSTLSQIKLDFPTKENAIAYAQHKNIDFEIKEPQNSKFKHKSYAENFMK